MSTIIHHIMRGLGLFLLATVGFFTGCVGNEEIPPPKDLISEPNYVDLLVEMQHIITYRNSEPDSVNADSLKQVVYDRYGITEEQFMESHRYYQSQVSEQLIRVNEAIRQMDLEEQYIQTHIDSIKAQRKEKHEQEAEEADQSS